MKYDPASLVYLGSLRCYAGRHRWDKSEGARWRCLDCNAVLMRGRVRVRAWREPNEDGARMEYVMRRAGRSAT